MESRNPRMEGGETDKKMTPKGEKTEKKARTGNQRKRRDRKERRKKNRTGRSKRLGNYIPFSTSTPLWVARFLRHQ